MSVLLRRPEVQQKASLPHTHAAGSYSGSHGQSLLASRERRQISTPNRPAFSFLPQPIGVEEHSDPALQSIPEFAHDTRNLFLGGSAYPIRLRVGV